MSKKIKKIPKSLETILKGNFIFYEDDTITINLEINDSGFYVAVYRQNIDWRNSNNSKKEFVDGDKPWQMSISGIEDMAKKMYKKHINKSVNYGIR